MASNGHYQFVTTPLDRGSETKLMETRIYIFLKI